MGRFLLTSTPMYGHAAPILSIGRALRERGHDVSMLTGRRFRTDIESAGMTFLPLPGEADYDEARLDDWLPGRGSRRRLDAGRYDIIGIFVRPMIAQHRALTAAVSTGAYDAVICETGFLGAMPTLLNDDAGSRVPIIGVSATPIAARSVDCAPFGSGLDPGGSAHTRRRNRFLNTVLAKGPLRPIQTAIDDSLRGLGIEDRTCSYFDYLTLFDTTFHLGVRGFEYPRRELPATVRFVGPITSDSGSAEKLPLPRWWTGLDVSRPIVHVTQGTLANGDAGDLLIPAIRALADDDVLVLASTGGRDVGSVLDAFDRRLPGNARIAEFIPYETLLPVTDMMITNGGYGGVQRALAHGIPLVVAGTTEDKPEVAARVEWSGAGINLRTARPSPARIRTAVNAALTQPRYRTAALRLQAESVSLGDAVTAVVTHVEELIDARAGQPSGFSPH